MPVGDTLTKKSKRKSRNNGETDACIHWGTHTFSHLTRRLRLPHGFQHSTDSTHRSISSAANMFLKVLWCQRREIMTRRHEFPVRAFFPQEQKIKMKMQRETERGRREGWGSVVVLCWRGGGWHGFYFEERFSVLGYEWQNCLCNKKLDWQYVWKGPRVQDLSAV